MTPETDGKVLIATDSPSDGEQLLGLLSDQFAQVRVASNGDKPGRDINDFAPHVVVMAFRDIEQAQQYCLRLYQLGGQGQTRPRRAVLLCSKENVSKAFDLCKKQYFDDYVLYWPSAQDGLRLPMSIWIACRSAMVQPPPALQLQGLGEHVKQLGNLEQALQRGFNGVDQHISAARAALDQLEREIQEATDGVSEGVSTHATDASISRKSTDGFAERLAQLRSRQLQSTQRARIQGLDPLQTLAHDLQVEVQPALMSTRTLADTLRQMRPTLLIVDDDILVKEIIGRALANEDYQLIFETNGIDAMRALNRQRPAAILMDIRMPGQDGISLTRHLKTLPRFTNIPVIMMTGDARRETLMSSVEAGAREFLVKPFTRELLKAKINRVLGAQ